MNKIKIVFLGTRNLGYQVLKWLIKDIRFEIIAVIVHEPSYEINDKKDLVKLANEYNLKRISLDEIMSLVFDIGLSINYEKILSQDILDLPKLGFWNLHHSYNLRLRGRNITSYAILKAREDSIYYHGTCLHKMIDKLDSGPILASNAINISNNDTAYTLYKKSDKFAYILIKEWIPRIAFEKIYAYDPPNDGRILIKKNQLPSREIKNISSLHQIHDLVRAFDFPGKEPAYIIIKNIKIHLVLKRRKNFTKKLRLLDFQFYIHRNRSYNKLIKELFSAN